MTDAPQKSNTVILVTQDGMRDIIEAQWTVDKVITI